VNIVIYFPFGLWDVKGFIQKGFEQELLFYFYNVIETCNNFSIKLERMQAIALFDFEQTSLAQLTHWKCKCIHQFHSQLFTSLETMLQCCL